MRTRPCRKRSWKRTSRHTGRRSTRRTASRAGADSAAKPAGLRMTDNGGSRKAPPVIGHPLPGRSGRVVGVDAHVFRRQVTAPGAAAAAACPEVDSDEYFLLFQQLGGGGPVELPG